MNADPTRRFSSRVADYVRFRPRYPEAVIDCLRAHLGLRPEHVVVDVGSGTGFFSELFLRHGHRVFGVEPNPDMRAAGERELAAWPNFTSIAGAAEATTLDAAAADFVVAGQAFHWFRPAETRREFQRILKPAGWVVLVWNDRRSKQAPFQAAYETLIENFRTDTAADKRTLLSTDAGELAAFFAPAHYERHMVPGLAQDFDFAGLQGRLLSSSYAPLPGHPRHAAMLVELRRIFDEHQSGGRVRFEHDTEIIYGRLGA